MNLGDQIFLPITVQELPSRRQECHCTEEEIKFIQSLELYKVLKFNSLMVGVYVFLPDLCLSLAGITSQI